MKKSWTLDQKDLDSLLFWLDEDIEKAGAQYQRIHAKLVTIFVGQGFFNAEDLADETINRVAVKIKEIGENYVGEKSAYFYNVAKKISLEATHRKEIPIENLNLSAEVSKTENDTELDTELDCLEICLKKLPESKQKLILDYYQEIESSKYKQRIILAKIHDLSVDKLRVQTYRIRAILKVCLEECLKKNEMKLQKKS